jgi:N-dimethylarginine dimethylaminohydrolase
MSVTTSLYVKQHSDSLFRLEERPRMPWPNHVLMVEPEFFDVLYVINPHMEAMVGSVQPEKAWQEWANIKSQFEAWGYYVHPVKAKKGLPDLVFCANQSLPCWDAELGASVVMGVMRNEQRREEVSYIEQVFAHKGLPIHRIMNVDSAEYFEGMGDVQWHPERSLLWAGHGFRTSEQAIQKLATFLGMPTIGLALQDERLYHLDTCFCMLNEHTVMCYPPAFSREGMRLIEHYFEHIIEVDERECLESFACNATAVSGNRVLLPECAPKTKAALEGMGFEVAELSTGEFLKSGGSVYCMKLLFWSK